MTCTSKESEVRLKHKCPFISNGHQDEFCNSIAVPVLPGRPQPKVSDNGPLGTLLVGDPVNGSF